ncbi:MAG: YdjY domain-containing protein [Phycisphaeraceae bacterium]
MRLLWMTALALLLALQVSPTLVRAADDAAPDDDAPERPAEPKDALSAAIAEVNRQDNGVTIHREGHYVDVEAKVCLRVGEFLEMFACTKDTREHESILVIDAQPSTMHLGLLLLGLEPGKPLSYDMNVDPPKLVPASGPKVKVYVVQTIDGEEKQTPANEWVKDNKTGKKMKGHTWLFAGSVQTSYEGKPLYLADVNGSVVSLVNFGDDLLTLDNTMTQDNSSHDKVWAPNTDAIPKVGTKVTLRLRPEKPKPAEDAAEPAEDKPAESSVPATGPPPHDR